jgi:dihydroflavonol-4-reductase
MDAMEVTRNAAEKDQNRIYIITGAAGHLGSSVIRCLLGSHREVRGLLLPDESPAVEDSCITYYHGDVCDIGSLRKLFADTEGREVILIHTAALISIAEKMPSRLYQVNVNGTKNVLRLCMEYNVKRMVHVSSVHAIPELPQGKIITEVDSFSADAVNGGYAKTKAEAAQAVLDAAGKGLDAVIVFPSGILGPYDTGRNHLIQMVREFMDGRLTACVRGGYDFVDVRDVAEGCLRAAENGRKGEGYILSGHYSEIRDLLSLAGKYCGKKTVRIIPIPLAKAAVPFIRMYAGITHRRPLYTDYSLNTLRSNSRFSNKKAVGQLGYSVRSLEETAEDMVDWIKNHDRQ